MATDPPRKGGGPIMMVHSQRPMESKQFLNGLREFPLDKAGDFVEILVL